MRVLHFLGIDILATGNDHILGAIHHKHVSVFVDPDHIARFIPSFFKSLFCRFRIIVIPFHHAVRLEPYLTDSPGPAFCSGDFMTMISHPGKPDRPMDPAFRTWSLGLRVAPVGPDSVMPYTW